MALRRFFSGPLIDEVALREDVQPAVAALGGALPDRSELRCRTGQHGIDWTTTWLHEAILASASGELVRGVDHDDTRPSPRLLAPARVRVVVVPTLFYREHPEIGGDGGLIVAIARRLGLAAEAAPVGSLASVEENARRLLRHLERIEGDEVWCVTLSKGGLELKRAFALATGRAAHNVRVWVNIAGVLGGSPIVDRMARSAPHRLFLRGYMRIRGGTGDALLQMGRAHAIAQAPLELPTHVDVLNLVPLPLPSHLPPRTLRTFRRLEAEGPNDGFVPFWDGVAPGLVYPLWGCDHYLRAPRLSSIVYRLLGEIAQRRLARGIRAVGGRT
jgi:hypothetical protein